MNKTLSRKLAYLLIDGAKYRMGARKDAGAALGLLVGIGIGAGLMYLLDPKHGSQRRSNLQDKLAGAFRQGDAAQGVGDAGHRRGVDEGSPWTKDDERIH